MITKTIRKGLNLIESEMRATADTMDDRRTDQRAIRVALDWISAIPERGLSQDQLRRAITTFTDAAIDESWKGIDTDPDEATERVRKLKRTHAYLDRLLRALPIPLNTPRKSK